MSQFSKRISMYNAMDAPSKTAPGNGQAYIEVERVKLQLRSFLCSQIVACRTGKKNSG